MKLGAVLAKEREKKGLGIEEMAKRLELGLKDYRDLEGGRSAAEEWGPRLAHIAIALETPTSHLLAESGRPADCRPGQAGGLIRLHRERRDLDVYGLLEKVQKLGSEVGLEPLSKEDYEAIEAGSSPIETYGPLLLRFAEVIEQPVFNLFYPCGLPFQELDDYP